MMTPVPDSDGTLILKGLRPRLITRLRLRLDSDGTLILKGLRQSNRVIVEVDYHFDGTLILKGLRPQAAPHVVDKIEF